ncbi:TetR/AcrR family transcriptional regulator [Paenochrobactrum sp. BZR 588]|uniref:TetR/AcrR family transcriptional regulator n=1 Tax=unclassified Paenochrobactrum TaxID=2639760 RepID=UPI003853D881
MTKISRTKPAEVRLDELMTAAETLFLAKGIDATTITDITDAAGVGKGTFYHYFSSKNDMLAALAKRYTERFVESVQQAIDACEPDDWCCKLCAWIHSNVETYVRTYRIHDIVYNQHHHHDRSNQAKKDILDQLSMIIGGGIAAGIWNPPEPRVVTLLIYAGVHGATDDIIATPPNDYKLFARNLADACLKMLSMK